MALAPRDIPITRDMVVSWVTAWKATDKSRPINDYIRGCVENLELPDDQVLMPDGELISVADRIIEDLPSYGIS